MLSYERLEEILSIFEPRTYSGRGMYGKQCLAIVSEGPLFALLGDIISECEDIDEATDVISRINTDSMGLDTVVYWPSIRKE